MKLLIMVIYLVLVIENMIRKDCLVMKSYGKFYKVIFEVMLGWKVKEEMIIFEFFL